MSSDDESKNTYKILKIGKQFFDYFIQNQIKHQPYVYMNAC